MNRRCLLSLIAAGACIATMIGVGPARAATGDHLWSKGFAFTGSPGAADVSGAGEAVIMTTFFGTVDLGGGPFTAVNLAGGDLVVAKFDATGGHVWSRQFTPVGGLGVSQPSVTFDAAGALYLSGWLLGGSLSLGGGAIAGTQGFIAKLDAQGNHVWSRGVGGAKIFSLDADGARLAIAGYKDLSVATAADFGGGPIGLGGGTDAVVAELDLAGTHVWSKGIGGTLDQAAFAVAIDASGNVALAGSMFGTVDFGGGPRVANGLDVYLVSFSSAGVHRWDHLFDGTFTSGGGVLVTLGLDAGVSGSVVLGGQFLASADFGGGPLSSAGFTDAFVARFDVAGSHQWSKRFGSTTGTDVARSVELDASGNTVLAGSFTGRTSFGGDTLVAAVGGSIFMAALDPSGAHLFSRGYGAGSTCVARLDAAGDILLHGGGSNLDFGGGPVPGTLSLAKFAGPGGGTTDVDPPTASPIAGSLRALPSPFRSSTEIQFALPTDARVRVEAYDVAGRLVDTLVRESVANAGQHAIRFDTAGRSGLFFVRLRAPGVDRTVKVLALP